LPTEADELPESYSRLKPMNSNNQKGILKNRKENSKLNKISKETIVFDPQFGNVAKILSSPPKTSPRSKPLQEGDSARQL